MFLVTYKTTYKCCYSYPEVPENGFVVRTYHEIPDASHKLKINEKLFKKQALNKIIPVMSIETFYLY